MGYFSRLHRQQLQIFYLILAVSFVGAVAFQNCSGPKTVYQSPSAAPESCANEPYVTASDELLITNTNFWMTSGTCISDSQKAEINRILEKMPVALKTKPQNAKDNALSLRWAVQLANHVTNKKIVLSIEPGQYDFSDISEAHPDVNPASLDVAYRPKLYIARNGVTLKSTAPLQRPTLTYSGPGYDGTNHGRVLLMIASPTAENSMNEVRIEGLHFQGDQSSGHLFHAPYYLHENAAGISTPEHTQRAYGLLMVGVTGGENHTFVTNCVFDRINWHGIAAVGNISIEQSFFDGIMPESLSTAEALNIESILKAAGLELGMSFHSGISAGFNYGSVSIKNSRFRNLTQGILGYDNSNPWFLESNHFENVEDHGIYILGALIDSQISDNTFIRNKGGAIKVGGNTAETDPLKAMTAARRSVFKNNHFEQLKTFAFFVCGSENIIQDNWMKTYSVGTDPNHYFDPESNPTNVYPPYWFSTHCGQATYFNHFTKNRILNNQISEGSLDIFIEDSTGTRSISDNFISGAGQTVYFHHRKVSNYLPTITVEGGATLIWGAPSNCSDCIPNADGFLP